MNDPLARDTSPEAAAVQVQILRGMSPDRKVSLVEDANRTARQLALAGIAMRYPQASDAQRVRLLMDLVLGRGLAALVYGPHDGHLPR